MEKVTKIISIESSELTARLFGSFDVNTKMIESAFGVSVKNRSADGGDAIAISGENADAVNMASRAVESLKRLARSNEVLTEQQVGYVISMIQDGNDEELYDLDDECICITTSGKPSPNARFKGSRNISFVFLCAKVSIFISSPPLQY